MSDTSDKKKNDALLFQFKSSVTLEKTSDADTSSIMESLIKAKKGIISQLTHTNHIHNDSHTDHSQSRPIHDKSSYGL
ncbi:MAG: hypothetical protein JSR17_11720 [Proteobacteria bacterium]|nr:hypothetical protein [Pseudomonadota bacterium]